MPLAVRNSLVETMEGLRKVMRVLVIALLAYIIVTCVFKVVVVNFIYAICSVDAVVWPVLFAVSILNYSLIKNQFRKWHRTCRKVFRTLADLMNHKIQSQYCAYLVDDFEHLAHNLAPSVKFLTEAKSAAFRIFEKLKQEGPRHGLKICRTKIAGSVGKGTGISYREKDGSIQNSDLDLVVLVNNICPPFTHTLQKFSNLLREMSDVEISTLPRSSSMQFTITGNNGTKINVDLLAGRNHVKSSAVQPGYDVSDGQAASALEVLTKRQNTALTCTGVIDQGENKLFSIAFAERTVGIIRRRVNDPFLLKIVRLAKYWNDRIILPPDTYIRGRSCVVEMVAIQAQKTSKARWSDSKKRCPISGFKRFLKVMSKFSQVDIELDDYTIPNKEGGGMERSTPVIEDPVNPFNNLAAGMKPEAVLLFEEQAKKTLAVLKDLKDMTDEGYEAVENVIEMIFCHKH